MTHACETAFQARIANLRAASFDVELEHSGLVHDALFCDLDPEQGASRMRFSAKPGSIFSLTAKVEGDPRWVVVRLELGQAAFSPGDVLGLVVKGAADRHLEVRTFLRMVRNGQFTDTRFEDAVALRDMPGIHTALHTVSAEDPACGEPGQCALVLGLPLENAHLNIEDMAFFLIPAAEDLRSAPVSRLSSSRALDVSATPKQ